MPDLLSSMAIAVDALTNPTQYRTPQHTWSKDRRDRHKKHLPDHVTVVPGLLTQLAAMAFPLGVAGDGAVGVRKVPQSKEPGDPRAIGTYLDIRLSVVRWSSAFTLRPRDTLPSTVRGLLGAAPQRPYRDQARLLSDMGEWQAQCEQALGLTEPDPMLTVPCPELLCGYRTLRVDLEDRTVRCTACGGRWVDGRADERRGSLDALAKYVTQYRASAETAADAARAENRRRKAALYGWHGDE